MTNALLDKFIAEHPIQMEADEIPVIVDAIKAMPSDGMMVEWGSGASTIRWLQEMTGNQRLISIEHNPHWYNLVTNVLVNSGDLADRLKYYLCPASEYWDHGYGHTREENPMGLDEYFRPDSDMYKADIFLIDGVARGVCAQHVLMYSTKSSPIIYIHDWYPRAKWYSWSTQLFRSQVRVGSSLGQFFK